MRPAIAASGDAGFAPSEADAIEGAPYGMFVCDANGTFELVNAAYEQLTGYSRETLIGHRTFGSLHDLTHAIRQPAQTHATPSGNIEFDGECVCLHRNRTRAPVHLAVSRIDAATPGRQRYVGIAFDLKQHAQYQARLWYVTHHDHVTRLPNQTLLTERLDLAITRCAKHGAGFTLLIIELDQLRQIGNALGQPAVDLALQVAAERLRGVIGPDDTIACVGGTQFVLVAQATGEQASVLVELIRARLAEWPEISQAPVSLAASIGGVCFPEHGATPALLIRRANVALAEAKRAGSGQSRFFCAAMEAESTRQLELETLLRGAIDNRQLHLVYQPQITLATGELVLAETLLRWRHPTRGAISPAEFIPVAEKSGLIDQLGEWVIRNACREASQLLRRVRSMPRISVNVSPQQLQRQDVLGIVTRALDENALEARYLEVEITEGVLLEHTDTALETIQALRRLGVEIAVDDFGTGYSSLAYLTRLPVDRLKIDQSFIRRMLSDPQCHAIVEAVIAMAHALKLRVTAEGVESAAHAARLTDLGCDEAQGFWFSRPLSQQGLYNVLRPLDGGALPG